MIFFISIIAILIIVLAYFYSISSFKSSQAIVTKFQKNIVKPTWYFDLVVEKVQFVQSLMFKDLLNFDHAKSFEKRKTSSDVIKVVREQIDFLVLQFEDFIEVEDKKVLANVQNDLLIRWLEYKKVIDKVLDYNEKKFVKNSNMLFISRLRQEESLAFSKIFRVTQAYRGDLMRSGYDINDNFNKMSARFNYITMVLRLANLLVVLLIIVLLSNIYKQNKALNIFREKLKHEINLIKNVRENLLMDNKSMQISNFNVSVKSKPSFEVGADYWEVIAINKKKVVVALADISGHGVAAGLVSLLLKFWFNNFKKFLHKPVVFVDKINKGFYSMFQGTGFYFTMAYSVIDLEKGEVETVSGGHSSPILVDTKTKKIVNMIEEKDTSPLVGIHQKVTYRACKQKLNGNQLMIYYTDGLHEDRNQKKEFYSHEKLLDFCSQNAELEPSVFTEKLFSELETFRGVSASTDDQTIIALKKKSI